ncbi:iron-sulfur cluster biosynthesis family protein [Ligilactobacillus sp. WILCCON 0076]|uniref:Iron-sulfur cluster biosynthesis family protein n=1 Tax=Ligilactobacillus ubinensis TaxID=2876789 RepID=A0A9X2FL96_9LACO|nr:iron-sulfur cluster biosynthesis family protein [Ligilactobacillus ubinensis]MCP0886806.1 iron-sulfur cluster biosynthesis family protein [Ligilactobacillus ubinensis]
MYLTITQEAKNKLVKYNNKDLLLDYDDGVGPLSKVGVCSLDSSFRILIVKKGNLNKDYEGKLDSDIGVIRYKDYTDMYMDDNMYLTVNPVNKMLRLTSDSSGELTSSVAIIDYS